MVTFQNCLQKMSNIIATWNINEQFPLHVVLAASKEIDDKYLVFIFSRK